MSCHRPLFSLCRAHGVRFLVCLCSLWALCLPGTVVQAAETTPVITAFVSHARLEADGTLVVAETITADMPGGGHGMFREIPFAVQLPSGQVVTIPPAVLAVQVDGAPVSTSDMEILSSSVARIYMRDTSRTLAKGLHTFVLTYSMPYMVGYFDDHDELNWNVTGDLWAVPIEKARYALTLPAGATINGAAAWVGVRGSREKAVQWTERLDNGQPSIQFASQRALSAGEGFTCAVSWNKGVVAQPAPPKAPEYPAWTSTAMLALAALVWACFCAVWWRVGRDPARGVVVPQFYAPSAPASFGLPADTPLSPAAVNYLMNAATLEPRGLSALFLALVCRRVCAISGEARTGFTLTYSGDSGADFSPYPEEQAVGERMAGLREVPLGKDGAVAIANLMQTAQQRLEQSCPGVWTANAGWTMLGAVLAVVAVLGGVVMRFGMPDGWDAYTEEAVFTALFGMVAAVFLAGFLIQLLQRGRGVVALGLLAVAGLVVWLLGDAFVDVLDMAVTPPQFLAGVVMTLLAPCVFGGLMKAPSPEARRLMDACEGLALYIRTAETDRFRQFNPPERTPELYTRLLPYAVALNLEKAWGENCAAALAQALQPESGQRPGETHSVFTAGTAAVVTGTAQGMAAYEASQSSSVRGGSDSGGSGSGGGGGGGGFC